MKRLLIWLGWLFVVIFLLVLFVITTNSGLRLTLWSVKRLAPNILQVESVEGRLIGPLDITRLSLSTTALTVDVDSLALRWSPSALLGRKLSLQKLSVDGVDVVLSGESTTTATTDNEPFKLPDQLALPISLDVRDVSVKNVSVRTTTDAEAILIDETLVELLYDRELETLNTNASVESSILTAKLSLNAKTQDAYPIDGQFDWAARLPELATIEGSTSLNGTINALEIVQRIASPYSLEANVSLNDALESLSIDAAGRLDMESASNIRADLPAIGVAGEFSFTGEPRDATLRAALRLSGELPGIINSKLQATVSQQLITLNNLELSVEEQPLALNANGTVDLSGTTPLADLNIRWSDLRWPWNDAATLLDTTGSVHIQGNPEAATVRIDTSLNETGKIVGAVNLAGQDIDSAIEWSSLQWPLDGSAANNITGAIKVDGQLDSYTLTMNSSVDTPELAGITLKASGDGTQESLNLSNLALVAADGSLDGAARVTWSPALAFDVTLDGNAFNPGVFVPEFPGNLGISLNAQGKTVNDTLQVALNALNIRGELRGQPLVVNTKATVNGSDVSLESFKLESGDTKITASGTVSDQLDLAFSLNSPDLSTLLPDASGSINGKGRIAGSPTLPSVDMNLAGRSLKFADMSLQSLDLEAAVDPSPTGPVAVTLSLDGGKLPGVNLESLRLIADGKVNDHNISLSGKSEQGDIDLALTGVLAEQRWSYMLQSSTLAYPQLAPWSLEKPAGGLVSADAISLSDVCLSSLDAQICLSLDKTTQALAAQYEISRFAFDYLKPFLPPDTVVAGTLNSSGTVSILTDQSPIAQFSAALNNVTVDVDNSDGDTVRLVSLKPSELTGSIDNKGAKLNALLDLGEQGNLKADVVVAGTIDTLMDASLSGRISGALSNIDVVEQMVPTLEDVQGAVVADFKLAGSPRKPLLTGELVLSDGNVALAEPGLVIRDATARISADNSSVLGVDVSAHSNEGSIRVEGTVDLATAPTPSVKLAVTGKQFQVVETLEAEAALSPNLNIAYDSSGLVVSGEVGIPVLAITPKKIPVGVVSVSEDQRVVGQETTQEASTPIDVRADVKILLGDDVFIDAFGLNAALSGTLTVKEVPGKETTATGQLEIEDGTFRAYGQNLIIQKGRIIYAGGAISKPGFDIEAVRKITSELQVGIRARGALANPKFSLFSDPVMSESEKMSYLVLGRPLQDNSPSENSAMRQAAMALGVAGGKLLTEKFGDKLGLDQVAIDSELRESGEEAALVVGKYLSPKLFVSYGIGLFEPVSTLKLDYSINRNIKLISETTESKSGGDILFTFEGGK